ncbi:MAG: hypothetical protein Q8M08_02655 [Bacteroidales bacterium]|nr:hypothetical protein [Bacteroidales bacterium]
MDIIRPMVLVTMMIQVFAGGTSGQTALKLPEILTKAEKRISINCLLAKTGNQLPQAWVVFSDREKGDTHFGDRFYVIAERETELHVFKSTAGKERKLISAKDKGWKNKSELLVSFGADFTENSLIHRKCVILNHHKTIERIKRGEISESEVPLYKSPTDLNSVDHVPLYLIYFVYKMENNRYLLGKDFKFDPDLPFGDQIIGWVDKDRVFDYNNRICFEPNFEEPAVAYRRCRPVYAAKVFEFESELTRFLNGDTIQKPIWIEPDYYFFRNPEYVTNNPGIKEPVDLYEKKYTASFLNRLCELKGNTDAIKQSRILTGRPLPGNKFRFPLIRMENLPENMFITGVTGRFENDLRTRALLCDALRANKSQITVYFILDNSIDRNRLTYVIGQIQQGYSGFNKRFGVCFFPRLKLGQNKISIDEKGSLNNQSNYQYVRDYIRNFSPDKSLEAKNDNILSALKYVLNNEGFDSRQTNIIVMVNNHTIMVPDTGLALLRREIQNKIVEKNCYLLTFDYKSDNNLVQQIQEISVAAAKQYAERLNIGSRNVSYSRTKIGYELENAGLLSIIEQTDSSQLAAVQMQSFLQTGYEKIVNTLNNAIEKICLNGNQPASSGNQNEDPFQRALKEIPGMDGKVQYIRALEEGYSSMKFNLPGNNYQQDIWKANVLMTKPELETIGSLLDKMLVLSNNSSFSKSVYELWIALFNRFVGDNLLPEDILPLTPQVIMNKILGETYGYTVTDPIKRFPLERILANDQSIQKYYDDYKMKLTSSKNSIKEILSTGYLRFSLDEDAANANQPLIKKGIYYYWVPMDVLP